MPSRKSAAAATVACSDPIMDTDEAYGHVKTAFHALKGLRRSKKYQLKVAGTCPTPEKKIRKKSDKPPSEKQLATRALFKKRIAHAKATRAEGETWKAAHARAVQDIKAS